MAEWNRFFGGWGSYWDAVVRSERVMVEETSIGEKGVTPRECEIFLQGQG